MLYVLPSIVRLERHAMVALWEVRPLLREIVAPGVDMNVEMCFE